MICFEMNIWGIVLSVAAITSGLVGLIFLFWGWNRHNRGERATLHFIIAATGGILFGGILYLGGKLGLLW